jgi:hypothetical protein
MGVALLGFLLKKNSIVENGPTGPLIRLTSTANAVGGWAGLVGVAVIALIAVSVATNTDTRTKARAVESPVQDASAVSESLPSSAMTMGWQVSRETNNMDHTKEAYISIDASNKIAGVIGSYRPTLIIQCRKHKPALVINVGSPLQHEYGEYESYAVRVKFDDGKPIGQRWTGSHEQRSGVLSPNPTQLIRELSKTDTFLFEFTPFERSETTAIFRVSGLKERFETVQDVCGLRL